MFPLLDDSPRRITPIVPWSIIAACFLVFLWQSSLGPKAGGEAIYQYGMIPARLFGVAKLRSHFVAMPAWSTVFTSMFLHGGWLHLGLNMLFLWVFGGRVEDSMGHSRFLVLYLLCGVAAAVAQAIMSPESTLPMVGASGVNCTRVPSPENSPPQNLGLPLTLLNHAPSPPFGAIVAARVIKS